MLASPNDYDTISNFGILNINEFSDHSPLVFEVGIKTVTEENLPKVSSFIKWEKDKVEEYKTKLNLHKNVMTEIVENLQQVGDANSAVKSLTDIIYNCAFEVFGSSRLTHEKEFNQTVKHNEWFNQRCKLEKAQFNSVLKIYNAICEHRSDRTFIRTAICDTIDKHMQENYVVVITGREGTGKSKICLELASLYNEKDYMVFKVDLSENHTIYTDIGNALLIIDDKNYTQDSLNTFMKHLLPVLLEINIKMILTCRNLDLEIVKRVQEIKTLKDEAFIDINKCLIPEEKEEMLRRYMTINNIATSSTFESNCMDPIILTDLSVQVKLDEDAIKIITNEEPWKGFPLSLLLFCSDRKCLHLGEKYFTNPPIYLVEELKELYAVAKITSNCIDTVTDYCILVYIMNNYYHQLDINDHNIYRKLDELYYTLFHFKNRPEKPGSNEDHKIAIQVALQRMNNKYLKYHEGVFKFIHPCLLKAVFLSSDIMVSYLLQNGSLHDITEFFRSDIHTTLENELVIKMSKDYHHVLCERLVRHAFESRSLLLHIAKYIFSYWRSSGNNLVNEMFKHIEFILFESLDVHTDDPLTHDNRSLSEKSIKSEGPVTFSKIIMLVDELTHKGREPWIYGPGSADFLILSALVSAAIGRYASNRDRTFQILLSEFQKRIHSELWSKPLDIYANTFLHYLMGLSQKEATAVLSVHAEMKYSCNTENVKKYTPLDIAAFLGKIDIFKVLNLKTFNCTDKLRKRLKRLAKSGQAAYYKENSKNINIDQPMIHKTKDDSAVPCSPCEDADINDKKEVIDENKKDKSFLKRKFGLRNEEPKKEEQHDRKDVLSFEVFMINIVDNGEIEDYQSIIKMLSK
ncbi:Hypothetical predicted protein [Mytilus galloprovincialis]|uniref:Novel STAND NTPase 3 domain-containing protein n=1 Tax=Mytilus galloprovincialis TaxID=29158 RepID=A0A8B6EMT4_MYTGA|nr:Hypothetical predicted protein [Mytilus galloprovincialis]